jgi:hypothetical protein
VQENRLAESLLAMAFWLFLGYFMNYLKAKLN